MVDDVDVGVTVGRTFSSAGFSASTSVAGAAASVGGGASSSAPMTTTVVTTDYIFCVLRYVGRGLWFIYSPPPPLFTLYRAVIE